MTPEPDDLLARARAWLDELATEHGAHVTDQWSIRMPGPKGLALVTDLMAGL